MVKSIDLLRNNDVIITIYSRTGLMNKQVMKCSEPLAVLCVENVAREP